MAGRGGDGIARDLPRSLRPLLSAAASLVTLRRRPGPRPTFVLGLEEQLRADMRLGAPEPSSAAPRSWRALPARFVVPVVVVVLLVLVGGGVVAVDRLAAPLVLDGPRSELAAGARGDDAGSRADRYLDLGWQRLLALESLLPSFGGRNSDQVRVLIASVVATYAAALEAIEAQDDARLALRAGTELRVARQLVAGTGTRDAPPVFVARVALATKELDRLIERADELARGLVVVAGSEPGATPMPPPTDDGPPPAETAGAATAELVTSLPPTASEPGQTPVATPTPLPTDETALPSATAELPVPSATPIQPEPQPTSIPPLATPTASGRTDPVGTPVKPTPTNTPDPAKGAVTVTPDSWPVTSTPRPRATDAPIVPTEHPGAIPSLAPPSVPPPTPGSTQLAPPAPEPTRSGQSTRP